MRTATLALFLAACTGAPTRPPVDDAADDATTDAAATPQIPAQPGLLTEAGFKALHDLKAEAAPPAKGVMITLPSGASAYLSVSDALTLPVPGVIVIHEWWGLNDHIRHWTDRLAADGYAALAVDLYGGKVASTPDEAMGLVKSVDEAAALTALREARAFLRADPRARSPKVGSVGWCFGGGWSLRLALADPDLDAAVIYYGRLTDDPAQIAGLLAPLLGHFGDQDPGIPVTAVRTFEQAVKQAGKPIDIHIYPAGHAFANPSGDHYAAAPAEEAWKRTRVFLRTNLR